MRENRYPGILAAMLGILLGPGSLESIAQLAFPEVFYIDSHSHEGASVVEGSVELQEGVVYLVTVEGTFSAWSAAGWKAGVCGGVPDAAPQFPSPGVIPCRPGSGTPIGATTMVNSESP
jgi:hypothetical protein